MVSVKSVEGCIWHNALLNDNLALNFLRSNTWKWTKKKADEEEEPPSSVEQTPSWEANSSSTNQENPAFYESPLFSTLLKRVRYLSLSWAKLTL